MKRVAFFTVVLLIVFGWSDLSISAVVENVASEETQEAIRLTFEISGEIPKRIDVRNPPKITAAFDTLQTLEDVEKKFPSSRMLEKIALHKGQNGSIEIILKDSKAEVEAVILPMVPPKAGGYKLVFDVFFSQKKTSQEVSKQKEPPPQTVVEDIKKEVPLPKESDQEATTPETQRPKVIPFNEIFFYEAREAQEKKQYDRATNLYKKYLSQKPIESEREALVGLSLSLYKAHENDLSATSTEELLETFQKVLKMEPPHPQGALIKCLMGIVYRKLDASRRAQGIFEELLKQSAPKDVNLCALRELGLIHMSKKKYLEAIHYFNQAVALNPNPDEGSELYFLLGKALADSGSYSGALEKLKASMEIKPSLYLKNPEVLKVLGETLLGMQRYDEAGRALLWYLNIEEQASKNDMLWAQIAETLFQGNKIKLAERLQNKIMIDLQDTEGAYITMLRKAQILEGKSKAGQMQALMIYETLAEKPLSDSLKFVNIFKWASLLTTQKKFDEALDKIDKFLTEATSEMFVESLTTLKRDIVTSWILEEHANKNYTGVVDIYNRYGKFIVSNDKNLSALAESFYELKDYERCADFYEALNSMVRSLERDWILREGFCAYKSGRLDRAEDLIKKIAQPGKAYQIILAQIYSRKNQCPDVVRTLEKLVPELIKEKEIVIVVSYLDCLMQLKNYSKALKTVLLIHEFLPDLDKEDRMRLIRIKAQCYEETKQIENVIAALKELLELSMDGEEKCFILYKLHKMYQSVGKVQEAESTLVDISKCEAPFWKKVGEQEIKYKEFKKKLEQRVR